MKEQKYLNLLEKVVNEEITNKDAKNTVFNIMSDIARVVNSLENELEKANGIIKTYESQVGTLNYKIKVYQGLVNYLSGCLGLENSNLKDEYY